MTVNQLLRDKMLQNNDSAVLALAEMLGWGESETISAIIAARSVTARIAFGINLKDLPTREEARAIMASHVLDDTKYVHTRTPNSVREERAHRRYLQAENSDTAERRNRDEWRRRFNNTSQLNSRYEFDDLLEQRTAGEIQFQKLGDHSMRIVRIVGKEELVTQTSGGERVGTHRINTIQRENIIRRAE